MPPTPHPPLPIAAVVFNLPVERSFHYLISGGMAGRVQAGQRVLVPFGPKERLGYVVKLLGKSPIRELKPIRRLVDEAPVITGERWELAAWIAGYYCCSLGEALALMVPSGLRVAPRAAEGPPAPQGAGQGSADGASAGRVSLSADQRRALEPIHAAVDSLAFHRILIHGVTASGKTELYLYAIERVLAQGRSAIYLIPEIALTPQAIERFQARFGGQVEVWHSRLTARQRSRAWARLAAGESRVVIGARSAVFAPVARPGVLILDEEHEQTYKQEGTPACHAREIALARARLAGAVVLLGSATPSIESYYLATQPGNILVTLPERIERRALPEVEIVDMREEFSNRRRSGPLSSRLERALEQTVRRGEQAMLLLNRRGFARVAQCQTCAAAMRCEECSVPLIYHAGRQELVCHYCGFHCAPPEICPQCKKGYLRFRGSGTERIESELHRAFPAASIARMDRDTMKRPERYHEVYEALKTQQVGLLVGTQMIAKGLDFPDVTLVGVVSADTALNLPDFRAGEWTFDLLTQMAGRAGRGSQPGRVVIQTFCPGHYAIQAARQHDYAAFYKAELAMRRRVRLPPFVHLVELTLRGASRQRVHEAAEALAGRLRAKAGAGRITLLGPAPHRIPRLRKTYRVCVLLKGRTAEEMVALLRKVLEPGRKFRGLPVGVDVDPL